MDRIHRSGLIALLLLLGIGAAGILIGPDKVSGNEAFPAEVKLNPGELPMVQPVPPPQRKLAFSTERFQADPVNHPIKGGGTRSINDSGSWTPEKARSVSATMTPPNLRETTSTKPASSVGAETATKDAVVIDIFNGEDDVTKKLPAESLVLRTIRVREGETLSEIASRELGSKKYLNLLANFNDIADPNSVALGQALKIPDLKKLEQASVGKKVEEVQSGDVVQTTSQWRSYTIQANDIGGRISQKMYGTTKHWNLIKQANGISDDASLQVGQVLRIPPTPQ